MSVDTTMAFVFCVQELVAIPAPLLIVYAKDLSDRTLLSMFCIGGVWAVSISCNKCHTGEDPFLKVTVLKRF